MATAAAKMRTDEATWNEATLFDFAAFDAQPLARVPFDYLVVPAFLRADALAALNRDFPPIEGPSNFTPERVTCGPAFAALIDALRGRAFARHFERKFDVVNCSFGTFGPSTTKFLSSYKRVVDLAFCENVLLIGACSNSDHRMTSLPASFPTVIATDAGRLEDSPLPKLKRRRGQLVEFVARGVDVAVSWKDGSSRTVTGSSFAAPHLAALVARIRQIRPHWNACEMKAYLYSLAPPVTPEDDAD